MDINELTAQKIKDFRLKLNYKAEEVARELGMDRANYSKLENGKTEITMKKLHVIANFFKVPIQSLINSNASQNISITHGDNSPIQNANIINNTDPFLADTIKSTIQSLEKVLEVIKR